MIVKDNVEGFKFCCIKCRGDLEKFKNRLRCGVCSAVYRIIDGIPSFLPASSDFYEGRWIQSYSHNEDGLTASAITGGIKKLIRNISISYGYSNRWNRFMRKTLTGTSGKVLDIGCNGGIEFYTGIGPVAGMDLSLKALKEARNFYTTVCQGDVENIPFPDDTFDFVVSTLVLGHIPEKKKDKVYSEIYRVLKKGGRTIHVLETDGDSLRYFKKNGFWERFKSHYGHDDMDPPAMAMQRFRALGLTPLIERRLLCHIIPVGNLSQNLTAELLRDLKNRSTLFNLLMLVDRGISRYRIFHILSDWFLNVLADMDNLFSTTRQAMVMGVCYKK